MNYFIKHNHSPHRQTLLAEAKGLRLLGQWINHAQVPIKVPEVITVKQQQLTLTRIDATQPKPQLERQLGIAMAKLHAQPNLYCGLEYDNFIGMNPQKNLISENWGEFFWQYRLKFQVELIQNLEISR
ncbi:MAG: fructosamine kinase family protein [Marinicella sp.]|nr:fructosamine kinase family protein [Xanthomonadales bacterium]